MASTPWYSYPITQGFKWSRNDTHAHSGVDIGDPYGTPLTAAMSGEIISQGMEPWGGQVNELVQTNSGPQVISYLHLSSLPSSPGHVDAGARIGSTGTPPPAYGNGPHLHFELTHGATPPYMGYNPWNPTSTSFPLDPSGLLNGLRGGTGGGNPAQGNCPQLQYYECLGRCNGDQACMQACVDKYPACNSSSPSGLPDPSAIVSGALAQVADGVKRAGVFIMAAGLTLAGLYLMLKPQVDGAIHDAVRGAETAAVAAV